MEVTILGAVIMIPVVAIIGYNMCIKEHWFDYEYEERDK